MPKIAPDSSRRVIGNSTLIHGDCLQHLSELPWHSVDLVLMDPRLYVIGDRQQVLVEKSSEGAGFVTNQTYIRIWMRGDGKPVVQTSIKLQDNSTVVSPYVALL